MQTPNPLSIIVIGGGIVGLAAAARLAQHGHTVRVLERKSKSTGGGGIQIAPNARLVFEAWGLFDEIDERAENLRTTKMRRYTDGRVLADIPRVGRHGRGKA